MSGWFEVQSGVGFRQNINLFQIKEVQRQQKQVIQIEHLINLKSREKSVGGAIGDELEISDGNIRLFNCSKLVFWLEEKQKVTKVKLFPSKETYQAALKRSFPNINLYFDQ